MAEDPEAEHSTLQRRILLSFCATVLMAVVLSAAYIAQKTGGTAAPPNVASGRWLTAPDPPAPLPESASPYLAGIAAANRGSRLKLDMLAIQDAWVEVAADGQVVYAKLVRAKQTLSFEAAGRIRMLTGNAEGLELRLNGKPVAATGMKGRVVTLEFTSEGKGELNSVPLVAKSA